MEDDAVARPVDAAVRSRFAVAAPSRQALQRALESAAADQHTTRAGRLSCQQPTDGPYGQLRPGHALTPIASEARREPRQPRQGGDSLRVLVTGIVSSGVAGRHRPVDDRRNLSGRQTLDESRIDCGHTGVERAGETSGGGKFANAIEFDGAHGGLLCQLRRTQCPADVRILGQCCGDVKRSNVRSNRAAEGGPVD